MKSKTEIADRHLLSVEGLSDKPLHNSQRVRIIISDDWAASRAGQLLTSCLVNLLARQIELVSYIEISASNTRGLVALPNGEAAGPFPSNLTRISDWATERAVYVTDFVTQAPVDFTVLIGTTHSAASGTNIFAVGLGWRAWVGEPDRAPTRVVPNNENPLGPFLAATLVASEIFKRTRGMLRGRFITANGYSLWSGTTSADWQSLEDGPELRGTMLPPIHIVGAGAVGNGLAYILANAALASGYAVVIDDDTYGETSLNRCFLAGWKDLDDPKVDAISRALTSAGLGVYPFAGTMKQYLVADHSAVRPDVARQADELAFEVVISCVDRGTSRQDLQGLGSSFLFGGSTLGLIARANFYPNHAGAACLSCFNPPERDGEKIRALEKRLQAMDPLQLIKFLSEEGIDVGAVQEYLNSPKCGTAGEAAVTELATRTEREFSAGFVSLGAALLLAAKLFQNVALSDCIPRGDMTSLNFQNGGYLDSYLAPDTGCTWGCQRRRL